MKYYIFLDDSGQLHKNYPHGDYFVYAGLVIKESDFHRINYNYKNLVERIKREKGIKGELKTSVMDLSTRRRLLKRLASYSCHQIFASVRVSSLVRLDFEKKKDVVRYKNYVIRRLVEKVINNNQIPQSCEMIEINIDNQNIAHSSIDSLEDHLYNFFNEENHYLIHKQYDTTSFKSDFKVNYKDSKSNYLIQAADLLANTEFNASQGNPKIRNIYKRGYTRLRLP